jgi:hypothetical protein
VDLTVQIMVNAPTHDLKTVDRTAARYKNGDVLAVYDTAANATFSGSDWLWDGVISSPRSMFIHITAVPPALVPKFQQRITQSIRAARDRLRLRQFRLRLSLMSVPARDQLLADKEITMTWTQFKSVTIRKIIINVLDASLDDESTSIIDGDVQ